MEGATEHLTSGGSPAPRRSWVAAPEALYVCRHLDRELGDVSRVELDQWRAVRRRNESKWAIAAELEGRAVSRRYDALAFEVPAQE
jgi:hypothetical protein